MHQLMQSQAEIAPSVGIGPINNFTGASIDVNNQSFSQLSQIGENLAESRDYDNPINQIRTSNRNFPNHSQMLRLTRHVVG